MAETVGERLETVRTWLGLTQQEFATRLAIATSTYNRYATGDRASIKNEQLEALAGLGVNLNWLVTGQGEPMNGGPIVSRDQRAIIDRSVLDLRHRLRTARAEAATPAAPTVPEGFVLVPRYDIEASAGAGTLAGEENVLDYMAFQESWVRRALRVDPSRLALITASGDSMEPAIHPGDLLLVDMSVETVMDDSIYLVALNDFLLVKRVQKLLKGLVVKSDNPNYTTMTLSEEEAADLRIRGRIRWIGRLI